mmetsp:Transcript_26874/g.28911  ORF Transcript_26874/g.28911 Transcript_26874/m.28911 type:complete len:261 (+) Transcript_26874:336-1118(+)
MGECLDGTRLVVFEGSTQGVPSGDLDVLGMAKGDRLDPFDGGPRVPLDLVVGHRSNFCLLIIILVELEELLQMANGKVGNASVADLALGPQIGQGPPGVLSAFLAGETLAAGGSTTEPGYQVDRSVHQKQVHVFQPEIRDYGFYDFGGGVVPELGGIYLGGQKHFLAGDAFGNGILNAPADCLVVHVEVGSIDVTASQHQKPLHGSLDAHKVRGRWTTAHSDAGQGHLVSGSCQGAEELLCGTGLWSQVLRYRGCGCRVA